MDHNEILANVQACSVPGAQTSEESRFNAHSLTDIQPKRQILEGHQPSDPSKRSNDVGSLDLQLPVHKCSESSNEPFEGNDSRNEEVHEFEEATEEFFDCHDTPTTSRRPIFYIGSLDNPIQIDEFEEATEEFFDCPTTSRPLPFMPNKAIDDEAAHAQFQYEFDHRYGKDAPITPSFFIGSLDDATQEAFGGAARKRKILAVYLHHDKNIQSNVFCSQLLCAPSVVEYMANNCVIWAWDITSDFNKQRLLDMCSKHFGSGVAATVEQIPRDGFPILVLAQGRRRSREVNTIIQGNTSLDELTIKLISAVDDAEIQKKEDIRVEERSEARERIKREQEEGYEESLKQDKEKQKKLEAEKAELARQQREEELREEEKNKKIEQLMQIVPPEPNPKCGEPISKIRFRTPCCGEVISRTFLASEKLQGLLNFVGSLGYLSEEYRVITSYPKRDISSLDRQWSLQDHKLFPQETLIIEEIVE